MFAVMEIFDGITTVRDVGMGLSETNKALNDLATIFKFNEAVVVTKGCLLGTSTALLYLALRSNKPWERRLVGVLYWVFAAISVTATINNLIL
jgi:hypothetical protein